MTSGERMKRGKNGDKFGRKRSKGKRKVKKNFRQEDCERGIYLHIGGGVKNISGHCSGSAKTFNQIVS